MNECTNVAAADETKRAEQHPVVIAGGGPTGLTLSILLAKLGISSLVLDQAPALANHPQVPHCLPDPRCMFYALLCHLLVAWPICLCGGWQRLEYHGLLE